MVSSKIASSTVEGVTNLELIKAELCREICGDNVREISVDSLSVSIYGKKKSSLKMKCANTNIRNFLLKQARSRKPKGIYAAEYLTGNSLKIFRQVTDLRRQYPQHFKAVYTKGGEVFCRSNSIDSELKLSSSDDIQDLRRRISSGSVPPPPPPPLSDSGADGGRRVE